MFDRSLPTNIIIIAPMRIKDGAVSPKDVTEIERDVVQRSFQPINDLLYLLGAPRIGHRKAQMTELTRAEKCASCLKILIIAGMAVVFYYFFVLPIDIEDRRVLIFTGYFIGSLVTSVLFPALLQMLRYSKLHLKLLNNLYKIDALLPLRKQKLMYGDIRRKSIWFIAIITIFTFATILNDILVMGTNIFLSNVPVYTLMYIEYIMFAQYINDINNICLRAAFVNDILTHATKQLYGKTYLHFCRCENIGVFQLLRSRDRKKYIDPTLIGVCDLRSFMQIYDKLADEFLIVNRIYSCQLLLGIIHSFIILVSTSSFGIHFLIEGNYPAVALLIWVLEYIALTLYVFVASSRITVEMETVKIILNKLQDNRNIDPRQRDTIEDFLRLCESSETEIKPYNLFTVNTALLSGYFTAVISYSIIVIQLLQSSHGPSLDILNFNTTNNASIVADASF